MAIQVMAVGRVAGAPREVSTDHGDLALFVLDPFPERAPAESARACEVRCRDSRLIGEVLRDGLVGAVVTIRGQLTMSRCSGPVEDDLCAVRVGIEADHVLFGTSRDESS